MYIYFLSHEFMITWMHISNPLGKTNLEVTVSSVRLQMQLQDTSVNLTLIVCNVDNKLSGRVSALHSVVTGSISSGEIIIIQLINYTIYIIILSSLFSLLSMRKWI